MNILDILDTMVASNVEASVAANGVRDNVIACDDKAHKNEQQGYEKEEIKAEKVNDTLDGQKSLIKWKVPFQEGKEARMTSQLVATNYMFTSLWWRMIT